MKQQSFYSSMPSWVYKRYRRFQLLNFAKFSFGINNDLREIIEQGQDFRRANWFLKRKLPSFHASHHSDFLSPAQALCGLQIYDYEDQVRGTFRRRDVKGASWFKVEDVVSILNVLEERFDLHGVLDPFAGWGARATGACMSGYRYIGIDYNDLLVWELQNIFKNVEGCEFINANSFKMDFSSMHGIDCVFTCPPYWLAEDYNHGGVQKNYRAFLASTTKLFASLAVLPEIKVIAVSVEDFSHNGRKVQLVKDLTDRFQFVGFNVEEMVYRTITRSFQNDMKDLKCLILTWEDKSKIKNKKRIKI